jgi:hypothetical protein
VRQALESASPPERKPRQGVAWRLVPFKPAIDAMLTEDTTAPRKQRHTVRRILARLVEEHGAEQLSYSTVRDYVRVPKAQIDVAAGRRVEVFIPQEYAPGTEAEVDFGEVWVMLNGVRQLASSAEHWQRPTARKASLQAKAPARIGIGSLEDRSPGYTDGTELLQHCEHLYATPVPGKLEAVFNVDQFAVEVS